MAEKYYENGKIGLLAQSGQPLTDALFDSIEAMYDGASTYIGYIGKHPFVIRESDGGIIDSFHVDAPNLKGGNRESDELDIAWTTALLQRYRHTNRCA